MADNNNVFILFEEIKTTLNGIKSKLEELPDVADRQPQIGNDKPDLSPIKEAVVETTKAQSEEIKDLLARQWEAYAQVTTVILKRIGFLKNSLKYRMFNSNCPDRIISTGTASTSNRARSFLSLWGLV